MTEEQLNQAQQTKRRLDYIAKTKKRVETLSLNWIQNDCNYRFSKNELSDDLIMIEIFQSVTETAITLLQGQLEKYENKTKKEFEKI